MSGVQGDGPNGDAFVRVTNREIYDAIISLRDRVAGVENIVENVLQENKDTRKRIRSLELRTYAVLSGCITALPMLARAGGIF